MKKFYFKINSWVLVAAVLAAGVAGTLTVYHSILRWREKIVQTEFRNVAGNRIAILQNKIDTELTALWSLQGFFAATPNVSREKFELFTKQLLRLYPDVDSYHWIVRVRDGERQNFETAVRKELKNPNFKITAMSGSGNFVPARKAEEYYPTLFVEPASKNSASLGFNQMLVPERKRCMLKSSLAKTMIATRIHPLWQFLPNETGGYFFAFLPVYEADTPTQTIEQRKDYLKGYVAAGFRVDRLVQAAFTTSDMSGLNLGFYAETVNTRKADIYQYQMYKTMNAEEFPSRYFYRETLALADQRWLVTAKSTPFFFSGIASLGTRLILIAGFSLTLLFCAFLILCEQWKRGDFFFRMSLKDELTGLYNRRGFLMLASAHLKLVRRKKMKSLMFFADLDGLKHINDTYGHEEGDRALAATGEILRNSFRGSDIVARTGGDEFAVFAFDVTDGDESVVARHLQENIDLYNYKYAKLYPYKVLLSVGSIPINPGDEVSIEKILSAADKKMYLDKRNHKVRFDAN